MLKLHAYQGCSTRPNAMQEAREGYLHSRLNTSGQDYRAMGLKDSLPAMKTAEALKLLSENGNLVKRPFAIDPAKGVYLVGFKEAEWEGRFQV
ncbi:MAG: hypothetical protein RL693_2589 [Verrucomicrobiota bacterium]|jgi:arsenate reductase